jgi:hypothetical protein
MPTDPGQATPEFYEIRVEGHLDRGRAEWFDGLSVTNAESGEAILKGPLADQPALYGVLVKIRDLGLPLLAVNRIEPAQAHLHQHGSRGTTQMAAGSAGMSDE